MKDNNITVGCNPPANTRFCPNDNVTRGQMSAFLKRLAENEVVNADAVDGLSSEDLGSRAAFNSSTDLPDADTTLVANIEAPARGVLVMNGAVDVTGGSDVVVCSLLVDGGTVIGTQMFVEVDAVAKPLEAVCATTGAIVVNPGSHTVTLNIGTGGNSLLFDGSVNAVWVPFNGSGLTPATVTPLGTTEVEDKFAEN
jgi:hypothetical protein